MATLDSPAMKYAKQDLKIAQRDLAQASQLFTDKNEINRLIAAIRNNPANTIVKNDAGRIGLSDEALRQINILETTRIYSVAEKTRWVHQAQFNIVKAREAIIKLSQDMGLLKKGLRVVQVAGGVAFIADGARRVYTWNETKADPNLSPADAFFNQLLK